MARIALVSSSFHPHPGGVEEHVRQLARTLDERGHDVVVWTVDRGEHLGEQRVDGHLVRYLPAPLPAARAASLLALSRQGPGAVRDWARAWTSDRPDLLHVHCFGPNGLYALALHLGRHTPLLVSSHGETFADPAVFADSVQQRWGLRVALGRAGAVTGCSQPVLDDLRARFGLRAGTVVPNGIRVEAAVPRHAAYRLARVGTDDPATVVAIGRLEAVKGFDLLVRALPRLRERLPGARLRIGGDGSQARALARLAADEGVADAVDLLGRLDADRVAAELAAADVVAVPSRRESFGLLVLEGWRSGTPVVVCDRDGPAELVEHGRTGLLVDPQDSRALAARLESVLTDPALAERLGSAGIVAAQGYSWDAVAESYERLYADLLGRSPGRSPGRGPG